MSRCFTIIFLLCTGLIGSAQNQTKKWYFGNGAAVNFSPVSPAVISGCAITTSMGCASISDGLGGLLFYTDGVNVYNQNNAVMANGAGLPGANAFQSAIILKKPSATNLYYVFTVGALGSSNGLYYSIVDMSLAAGMGSVTIKNVLVHADCRDKLTAGRHCNGSDLWVLSSALSSTTSFVACQLSSAGINTVVETSSVIAAPVIGTGQIRLSPNSHKLGIVSYQAPGATCGIDVRILNFDSNTGLVLSTGASTINYSTYSGTNSACTSNYYGCEFSQDSRFMYLAATTQVTRIDLCSLPFISTGIIPNAENAAYYDTISKRSMQMAPDGRIYVAKNGKPSLGAINNPSSLYATTYSSVGVSLGTYTCQWGLPNFPAYLFEQKPTSGFSYSLSSGNCLTAFFTSSAICAGSGYTVSGYQWNFGEPSSGSNNSSSQSNPSHFYSNPGTYSVTMVRYFQCNDNDTIRQVINVVAPAISVLNSPNICSNTTATAQVTAASGTLNYVWSPSSQTTAIATFTSSGIYTITVTDPINGYCTVTATTAISVVNLSTSVSTRSVLCFQGVSGSASITVSGGSGNYFYGWIGASSGGSVATALAAGVYTVNVLDNVNLCTITRSITVTQPSALQVSVGSATNTCFNQTITLYSSTSGGTPNYTVTWPGIANTPNAAAAQTLIGTSIYSCVAVDANNCTATKTIAVVCNPLPALSVSAGTLCAGDNLTLTAAGASSYSWSNTMTSNSIVLINPNSGTLGLIGYLGPCSTTTSVNIVSFAVPNLSITASSPLCAGQTLTITGIGQGNFQWMGPSSYTSNLSSLVIPSITVLQAGTFSATVTDSNSCLNSGTVSVTVYSLPIVTVSSNTSICVGEGVALQTNGADTYSWSSGQQTNTIQVTPQQTTVYNVTGTSSLTGCSKIATVQVSVQACLGLNKINTETQWQLYPNPNQGKLIVKGSNDATYLLIDVSGNKMLSGTLQIGLNEIHLDEFAPGYYLLKITTTNGTSVFAVVKE
jgi:hypothetical protein